MVHRSRFLTALAGLTISVSALSGCSGVPDEFTLLFQGEDGDEALFESASELGSLIESKTGIPVQVAAYQDFDEVRVSLSGGEGVLVGGLAPLEMVLAEREQDAHLLIQETRYGLRFSATQWFTNDPETFCADRVVSNDDGYLFCNDVLGSDMGDGPYGSEMLEFAEGEAVAFVSEDSVDAYAIPSIQLLDQGIDPISGITSLFSGGHDATVQAVYDGRATVGVSRIDARPSIADDHPDVRDRVVVFGWSGPIPYGGFVGSSDLSPDARELVQQALVAIGEAEDGAQIIADLYGYEALIPAVSSDYGAIRDVATELGDLFE